VVWLVVRDSQHVEATSLIYLATPRSTAESREGVPVKVAAVLQKKGNHVHTIHPAATVADAANSLAEAAIGALVVTIADGTVVGILSERDLVRGLSRHGCAVLTMTVADLMTRRVNTCTSQDSVTQMMRRMTTGRHRHMPVVDRGRLVGIVSIGDVVKNRIQEIELEQGVLRDCYLASR
jgi:CBS domain-containing protein